MSQNSAGTSHKDVEWDEADFHCITCSDEAVRVVVISVDQEAALVRVEVGTATEEIDISLVDAVLPGDILLAHGGVALTNLSVIEVK